MASHSGNDLRISLISLVLYLDISFFSLPRHSHHTSAMQTKSFCTVPFLDNGSSSQRLLSYKSILSQSSGNLVLRYSSIIPFRSSARSEERRVGKECSYR